MPNARQFTILYGDIVRTSAMIAQFGDLAVLNAIRKLLERLEVFQKAHRGQFVKSLGDSFLMIFDEVSDALSLAIDIQRSLQVDYIEVAPPRIRGAYDSVIRLRVGLHTGPVSLIETVYGREILGQAVVIAARITAYADPGTIVMTKAVERLLSGKQRAALTLTEVSASIKHEGILQISKVAVPTETKP